MILPPASWQQAVRAATHRALAARERLVAGYPHWESWRRQARASKDRSLGALDDLLAQLCQAVRGWGGEVLWARDGAEARRLILKVARQHGVQRVVKSKSMTTQEIALNPFLAAAGLQVTETDLGEFLVQLAGHAPCHLTAPALHLDRREIARLLKEHLGLDLPPDPEVLTREACGHLRPHYAEADLGITGVNFAAPDGTLVFLENEGNLRLTAMRPRVHLALMGVEKMISSLRELEVFLRLLPASATGQRLTALVHFLRGAKTGPEGPQAFYLVLLDNGRRRLAADPDLCEALSCLRCGACLNICPVFQLGGAHLYGRVYPGAIGILLAPFLGPEGDIADLCTQCGACGEICPVGLGLPEKIRLIRRASPRFRNLRRLSALAGQVLGRPGLYRGLGAGLRSLSRAFPPLGRLAVFGDPLAPESFFEIEPHLPAPWPGEGSEGAGPPASPSPAGLGPSLGERPQGPEKDHLAGTTAPTAARWAEVGSAAHVISGPAALARFLAEGGGAAVWLASHPWLEALPRELALFGVKAEFSGQTWAPVAETVVSVAAGAVPETGSVVLAEAGTDAWLPFRARRQVVLVPPAPWSLAQALNFTGAQAGSLVTWLTGPTRTADIEKILILGAQGPAELEVVIYEPGGAAPLKPSKGGPGRVRTQKGRKSREPKG